MPLLFFVTKEFIIIRNLCGHSDDEKKIFWYRWN